VKSDAGSPEDAAKDQRPREIFSLYLSRSGKGVEFTDPREAGRAFFHADPEERPIVIHAVDNTARTMARTEIHGQDASGANRYFKALPSSHAPDAAFREGFLEAVEQSLTERLGRVDWTAKDPTLAARLGTRLDDDLEAFAYREPGKAAALWAAYSEERPPGPVLGRAILKLAAEAVREQRSSELAQGEPGDIGHGMPALSVEVVTPPDNPRRKTAIYAGRDAQLIVTFGRDDEVTRPLADRLVADPGFRAAVALHIPDAHQTLGQGTFTDGEGSGGFLPDQVLAVTIAGKDGTRRVVAQFPDRNDLSTKLANVLTKSSLLNDFGREEEDMSSIAASYSRRIEKVSSSDDVRASPRSAQHGGFRDLES
jgi:hypothetical protein